MKVLVMLYYIITYQPNKLSTGILCCLTGAQLTLKIKAPSSFEILTPIHNTSVTSYNTNMNNHYSANLKISSTFIFPKSAHISLFVYMFQTSIITGGHASGVSNI